MTWALHYPVTKNNQMKKIFFLFLSGMLWQHTIMAQEVIKLYQQVPGSIQNAEYQEKTDLGKDGVARVSKVTTPTLTVFRPNAAQNSHTAVVICPGGGYGILAINKEGTDIAKTMASWGITAVVLKYRLPSDKIMKDKSIGPLQDAERAIQIVREHAKDWEILSDKVGIMGFSAGGHLAATASTHLTDAVIDNPNQLSLRPDFSILAYPVISMQDGLTHMGSRNNLLGKSPDTATINGFSNELQVTENTPPTFLVQASDDRGVSPLNSLRYYEALLAHHIPVEMHLYQNGGHGFGAHNETTTDDWMIRLKHWLQHNHFLPEVK